MSSTDVSDPSEYRLWVQVYNKYLNDLYKITRKYLPSKEKKNLDYEKFCLFVYRNSSGDIYPYY